MAFAPSIPRVCGISMNIRSQLPNDLTATEWQKFLIFHLITRKRAPNSKRPLPSSCKLVQYACISSKKMHVGHGVMWDDGERLPAAECPFGSNIQSHSLDRVLPGGYALRDISSLNRRALCLHQALQWLSSKQTPETSHLTA